MGTAPIKLAVLVSGNGSNFQAIIDAIEAGRIPNTRVACLISNKSEAFALERARKHNVKTIVLDHKAYPNRQAYDTALVELLRQHEVDLVILAGFMRLLSPIMIDAFPNAIMNIHPALLPAFPGLDAQQQAFDYGVRYTGCTVHFVDKGTDTGPIILQSVVPVLGSDTIESLTQRIHGEEHRTYVEAVRLFCAGRLKVEGRKVIINE
ncbi:phosphoribosylglycinamide formyltransferase [Trichlorobacter lovleyi]|uniref:Phosphoribosylglycinamide formyltransferase n=1 Tax=Trichlorobacter lovleyi (strain ATCC BAA-1151 / DSM 17278 / SZ) TaxID=398767 RepID=B3E3K4_TRIL1|nr:phosphoribosylglycinamide formyltransferase [Trichlorobacter lovleyi]ACD95823.1 phosphoribosylglycinamide formyltransferase [Trichlorobacter lovleyi SZ]